MSFFSSAWKLLIGSIEKQGPQLTRITLPRRGEAEPIEAQNHYFRIWLKDMRLSANNRWFTDLYPACHSLVAQHYGNEKIEITRIIGPVDLGEGIDVRNLDRSILLNQPLTPLLPFNGGVVDVGAGLISIPARNELESFLGVVSAMSARLNVPQVSAVLGKVDAVSSAVTEFLGVSDPTVQLTYGESYTATGGGGALEESHILLASLPDGTLAPERLWVREGRVVVGDALDSAGPLDGCDYMLLHIERVEQRDDWAQFKEISQHLDQGVEALMKGEAGQADLHEKLARAKAATSPDLTDLDRVRVVGAIARWFERYRQPDTGLATIGGDAEHGHHGTPTLNDAMAAAPSPEEAREKLHLEIGMRELIGK